MSKDCAALEHQLEESERKGLQLCNAAGMMMLACKRLRSLQELHGEDDCGCDVCTIVLPDLSNEGVEKLVNESNESFARLLAAAEARGAERERERARAEEREANDE